MKRSWKYTTGLFAFAIVAAMLMPSAASKAYGQETGKRLEIYGFIMADLGHDFGQSHPDWFDVVRPTKLPSFEGEYGDDGRMYFGVRQTRFGARAWVPTEAGELKTTFEWEM